jgi:hypothetical protein
MNPRFAYIVGLLIASVTAIPAGSQTLLSTKSVEVSFQNYMLRGAVVRDGWDAQNDFLRDYYGRGVDPAQSDAYLAAYSARFYGLERYEASTGELALYGIGTGASLGLFAGALGQTLGLWDEDKSWLLVGAMTALGAVWGASKADDPEWRYRYRWEELDRLTVPTE